VFNIFGISLVLRENNFFIEDLHTWLNKNLRSSNDVGNGWKHLLFRTVLWRI